FASTGRAHEPHAVTGPEIRRRSSLATEMALPLASIRREIAEADASRLDTPPTPTSGDRSGASTPKSGRSGSSSPHSQSSPDRPLTPTKSKKWGLFSTSSKKEKRKASSSKHEAETTALDLPATGVSGRLAVSEREWRISKEIWE